MPPNVIIKYSTFFKDELTLDNMPRMQLMNLWKVMSILPPHGNSQFLMFQHRHVLAEVIVAFTSLSIKV